MRDLKRLIADGLSWLAVRIAGLATRLNDPEKAPAELDTALSDVPDRRDRAWNRLATYGKGGAEIASMMMVRARGWAAEARERAEQQPEGWMRIGEDRLHEAHQVYLYENGDVWVYVPYFSPKECRWSRRLAILLTLATLLLWLIMGTVLIGSNAGSSFLILCTLLIAIFTIVYPYRRSERKMSHHECARPRLILMVTRGGLFFRLKGKPEKLPLVPEGGLTFVVSDHPDGPDEANKQAEQRLQGTVVRPLYQESSAVWIRCGHRGLGKMEEVLLEIAMDKRPHRWADKAVSALDLGYMAGVAAAEHMEPGPAPTKEPRIARKNRHRIVLADLLVAALVALILAAWSSAIHASRTVGSTRLQTAGSKEQAAVAAALLPYLRSRLLVPVDDVQVRNFALGIAGEIVRSGIPPAHRALWYEEEGGSRVLKLYRIEETTGDLAAPGVNENSRKLLRAIQSVDPLMLSAAPDLLARAPYWQPRRYPEGFADRLKDRRKRGHGALYEERLETVQEMTLRLAQAANLDSPTRYLLMLPDSVLGADVLRAYYENDASAFLNVAFYWYKAVPAEFEAVKGSLPPDHPALRIREARTEAPDLYPGDWKLPGDK